MVGYVAVTRARLVLDTGGLAWVHDYAADYDIDLGAPDPAAEPAQTSPDPAEMLAEVGLSLGMNARVDGEKGVWRLVSFAKDGSVSVIGGPHDQWRSFMPEWCYPAEHKVHGGRRRPGTLPPQRHGLRAAWRAQHGFARPGVETAGPPVL